jgi:hypothetical protein
VTIPWRRPDLLARRRPRMSVAIASLVQPVVCHSGRGHRHVGCRPIVPLFANRLIAAGELLNGNPMPDEGFGKIASLSRSNVRRLPLRQEAKRTGPPIRENPPNIDRSSRSPGACLLRYWERIWEALIATEGRVRGLGAPLPGAAWLVARGEWLSPIDELRCGRGQRSSNADSLWSRSICRCRATAALST